MAQAGSMSYAAFKMSVTMLIWANHRSRDGGQFLLLPGERNRSKNYSLLHEKAKRFGRSINLKLAIVEANGGSITSLKKANILVTAAGKVSFIGEETLYHLSSEEREDRLKQNYKDAADIFDDLLQVDGRPANQQRPLPPDVKDLLNLMRYHFDDRLMFPVHGALVPASSYGALYKELHDHIKDKIPVADHHDILDTFPDVATWESEVQSSELLSWTYNAGSYAVPAGVSNTGVLVAAQKSPLESLKISTDGHPNSLSSYEVNLITKLRPFSFLRDRYSHKMEVPQGIVVQVQVQGAAGQGQVPGAGAPGQVPGPGAPGQAPGGGRGQAPGGGRGQAPGAQVAVGQVQAPHGRGRGQVAVGQVQAPHGRGRGQAAAAPAQVQAAAPQVAGQAPAPRARGRARGQVAVLAVAGQNGLNYTSKSSELVTKVRFPSAIPVLQYGLHRKGLLEELDLEVYFGPSD